MKKFLIMILLIAGGKSIAYGQTEQGNMVIAGSFSVSGNQHDNRSGNSPSTAKHWSTGISPSTGYFIKENLEAGASIGYNYSHSKSDSESYFTKSRGYAYNFSPYLRKYIPVIDNLYFHGTGAISVGFSESVSEGEQKADSTTSKYVTRYNFVSITLSPGITYFVTDRFALSTSFGSVGYGRSIHKPEEGPKSVSQSLGLDLNLSAISFGLNYFINRQ